ncbi:MAG: T9SS type A sorting domain-containing protein, partial [Bacteroidota bacterium]|nr:T9SS type A sorting domain-containing protein [Bacteroidota bacterium]
AEKDFHYVAVYRSNVSGFSPKLMTPYATVGGTQFTDAGAISNGQRFYYRLSSVDFSGNESSFSPEISASIDGVEVGNDLPTEFALSQNYPNPFNPTTRIGYSVPEKVHVTLKVYDVLGREVATLIDGERVQGRYETEFDGSRFASGVYVYRIQAGSFTETRRFILQK